MELAKILELLLAYVPTTVSMMLLGAALAFVVLTRFKGWSFTKEEHLQTELHRLTAEVRFRSEENSTLRIEINELRAMNTDLISRIRALEKEIFNGK
jgi:shikimate 5-dehydrogenase